MGLTLRTLHNTTLQDRVLWYDGHITIPPEQLFDVISRGVSPTLLHPTHVTEDVLKYNKMVSRDQHLHVKCHTEPLSTEWLFPSVYKSIDVENFVFEVLEQEIEGMTNAEKIKRINRTVQELDLFFAYSLSDVLKLMIYVIDTFEQRGVVWGVGRGSSVSSYVLYLLGVHDIDSVEYDLPIEDFLRE